MIHYEKQIVLCNVLLHLIHFIPESLQLLFVTLLLCNVYEYVRLFKLLSYIHRPAHFGKSSFICLPKPLSCIAQYLRCMLYHQLFTDQTLYPMEWLVRTDTIDQYRDCYVIIWRGLLYSSFNPTVLNCSWIWHNRACCFQSNYYFVSILETVYFMQTNSLSIKLNVVFTAFVLKTFFVSVLWRLHECSNLSSMAKKLKVL